MGCCLSKSRTSRTNSISSITDKDAYGLSYVGKSVYEILRTKHSKHHHAMWNITQTAMIGSIHQTPSADTFTDEETSRQIDQEDQVSCNWLADKMCEIMSRTTKWCDVMSLAAPDGYFRDQFKVALKKIADNAKGQEEPIVVRLMFGNILGLPINCERVKNKLTEDLPADTNVQLWVGAWRYGASWNHSKLIAVDGKYLHTGGHNLWSDIYLKKDPVHDISLEMEGGAAHDAHLFANDQWRWIEKKQDTFLGQVLENVPDFLPLISKSRVIISEWPKGKAKEFAPYYERSIVDNYKQPEGAVPVISIGRQGTLVDDDRPADDAFIAMIDAAKKIIRMALQDLGPVTLPGKIPLPGTGWPRPYFDAIARAIWERGVDFEIILSNKDARRGYTNGWSADDVASEIIKHVKKLAPKATDGELRQKVEDNLRISYIRHKAGKCYASGMEVSNHSKYFIVDDVCSYTGSQNLYVCDLAEWGVLIDDANITAKMMEDYWNPMWKASFYPGDCEVQDVMDGLNVDRDGDVVNTYSVEGKKKAEEAVIAMARKELPPDTGDYDEDEDEK